MSKFRLGDQAENEVRQNTPSQQSNAVEKTPLRPRDKRIAAWDDSIGYVVTFDDT